MKEEIRQRVDLVDVVSEHVALKRGGRDFIGLCPFHQEKTPSFSVSPAKQIFKCFGCGAGGDVFSFIQMRESVDFVEAMRILADRAGIDFDRRVGRAPTDGIGRADLARVNAWACETFQRAFRDENLGRVAREYVAKRKIAPEMVEAFAIGWAPEDAQWIMTRAGASGVKPPLLRAAGLIADGNSGDYGVFRGRLMFPIRDTMNRVIGFGGRTLIDDRAKYLNTSQNTLFDKGRNLFGIDQAREEMGASRCGIVVEGYTDCIALHQHGVKNVVATLGTALTDAQVGLLRRWCDEVIFVFDADAAGQNAADRAVGVALRYNLNVRIAHLASGKDPAEFLETQGADEFRGALKSAVDALVFKWRRTRDRFTNESGGGRKEAIREFIQVVAGMSRFRGVDPIQQGLIVNQLAQLLSLPGPDVHKLLLDAERDVRRAQPVDAGPVATVAGDAPVATLSGVDDAGARGFPSMPASDMEQAALTVILQVLLNEPGLYADVADVFDPGRIVEARTRRIAEVTHRLCEDVGEFQLGEVLSKFHDIADARWLTELVYRGERVGNFASTAADAADRLRRLAPRLEARDAAERRRIALEESPETARAVEDEWLRRVHGAGKSANNFAPGIPAAVYASELHSKGAMGAGGSASTSKGSA
ncbi:MAG: DNA primase [Phycisphaerales bacterium]|nr:DNA primase [Phycisphaerales bacterium]